VRWKVIDDVDEMDVAATCFNLMELIDYWQREKKMMMMVIVDLIAKDQIMLVEHHINLI